MTNEYDDYLIFLLPLIQGAQLQKQLCVLEREAGDSGVGHVTQITRANNSRANNTRVPSSIIAKQKLQAQLQVFKLKDAAGARR